MSAVQQGAVPVERVILLFLFGLSVCGVVAYLVWLVVRACQRRADRWAVKRAAELAAEAAARQAAFPVGGPAKKKGKKKPVLEDSGDEGELDYPYGAVNGAEGDGVVLMDD